MKMTNNNTSQFIKHQITNVSRKFRWIFNMKTPSIQVEKVREKVIHEQHCFQIENDSSIVQPDYDCFQIRKYE